MGLGSSVVSSALLQCDESTADSKNSTVAGPARNVGLCLAASSICGARSCASSASFDAHFSINTLILNIDLKPGRIKNWRKPVATDIEKMIEANQED